MNAKKRNSELNIQPRPSLHAHLGFPCLRLNDDGLAWRIELLDRHKIIPKAEMWAFVEEIIQTPLNERETNIEQSIESPTLTEVDVAILTATYFFLKAETLPLDELKILHLATKGLPTDLKNIHSRLEVSWKGFEAKARTDLLLFGQDHLERVVPKIRARLALFEILGAAYPRKFIPQLVALFPHYFQNEFVCAEINRAQKESWHSSTPSLKADIFLKSIAKAIQGDKRKKRSRIYPYWQIYLELKAVQSFIEESRASASNKEFSMPFFLYQCESMGIPLEYRKGILDSTAPGQLALNIVADKHHMKDTQTLKEIRASIAKVDAEYSFVLSPIPPSLLDLSTRRPLAIPRDGIVSVLEMVK